MMFVPERQKISDITFDKSIKQGGQGSPCLFK